jgi:hypothetical protein
MNSQIENALDEWFRETEAAFKKVDTHSPVDSLCCSITAVAHNYCSAILSLLNRGHRLPAMALLRVLAELAFRLIWCLYTDNPQKESCEVRIKRWLKAALLERKKFVKRMSESNLCSGEEVNAFKRELEELEQNIGQIPHKAIGNFYNSLRDLPEPYRVDLYPRLYSIYNWGIHPDCLVLMRLVKQNAESNIVVSDVDEDPGVLKIYCLTMAFNILAVVRKNYGWDYDTIKREYLEIKKDFSKKRRENSHCHDESGQDR